jgi:diguanylate cyclase (GGDEF)-like protein/PAS domain S-box-containing protein
LTEQNAVPLIVMSSARDPVEAINSILRRAGHPVHCTWIAALRDLSEAITKVNPELLVHVGSSDELQSVINIRDQSIAALPIVVLAEVADETRIANAMIAGARDVVTLANPVRLQAVMLRELRAYRLERALNTTVKTASDARSQLETVLARSNDAIVQIQEGIVVDANPAWVELFGADDGLLGQPVMDLFDESTQPALRGALAACLQGRWNNDHALKVNAILGDGTRRPVEVVLALGEHEGEPSIRLVLPRQTRDETKLAQQLSDAVRSDATTGLLHRRDLLEALRTRLESTAPGGVRSITLIKLDKFATIERDVGVVASDEVLTEFAKVLKETLHPKEVVGRFGGVRFLALLERGNEHDIEAWGEQLIARIKKHVVRVKDKTISLTCSVGLSVVPPGKVELEAVIADAMEACRKGAGRGGNQTVTSDRADNDNRVQSYDKVWVKHIKAALMENRFRLVQQPVASLQGEDPGMFDVLVRMIDTQGKEVLPGEFMAAAERNDLLKNIDRWVVGASLSFAAQRRPGCLFVRLSKDTAKDGSFLEWLENHVRSSRAEPQRLCFQVTEELASSYVTQVKALASALRQKGFRFALDQFGSGRDSQGLLDSVPLDFVKIDGALVQGLTGDPQLQQRVRVLVEAATKRLIQTIGERVEDANTMAVLWQVGVQYIQGYFLSEPEQVVLRAEGR